MGQCSALLLEVQRSFTTGYIWWRFEIHLQVMYVKVLLSKYIRLTIWVFDQNSIFGQNFGFRLKFDFLSKFGFSAKIPFLIKISVFDQNSIFGQNFGFPPKFHFWSKFLFFVYFYDLIFNQDFFGHILLKKSKLCRSKNYLFLSRLHRCIYQRFPE